MRVVSKCVFKAYICKCTEVNSAQNNHFAEYACEVRFYGHIGKLRLFRFYVQGCNLPGRQKQCHSITRALDQLWQPGAELCPIPPLQRFGFSMGTGMSDDHILMGLVVAGKLRSFQPPTYC